jgi:hypothetical protein
MEILMQYFCGLANGTCTENLELHNQSLHQLANGTCTENLELHNQSLHQPANDVDAWLSSIDAEALLSPIEDTEDSDGQRKPTWREHMGCRVLQMSL